MTYTPDPQSLVGRTIVVPGSTSNLGPGFDALGLALQITLRLHITEAHESGEGQVEWRFAGLRLEGENAIERAYRAAIGRFCAPGLALPSMKIDVVTEIPMRAGLGSSAAALVAGLRLAQMVAGVGRTDDLLSLASELEGHPDNTSASLLGGFVTTSRLDDGRVVARAAPWPREWPLVIATPALALETKVARAALPASVSMADAVFNVQRAAQIVQAVHLHDGALLRAALDDRLHQPYRAPLVPGLAEALHWEQDGLLGTYLSGGGPSIAAIVDEYVLGSAHVVRGRFEDLYRRLGLDATIRVLHAHQPL